MPQQDPPPPTQFVEIADQLDVVAQTVREYLEIDPKPWPESVRSREVASERDFDALPFEHPMIHVHVMPGQYLGSAQDHLTAFAGVIRTPQTVLALLTILRSLLVGAATASWLGDPRVDGRERMRRGLNLHLESLTEQMRLVGRDDQESAEHYDELEQQRREIKAGAKALGWTVAGNETPLAKAYPQIYRIEPSRSEMDRVSDLLGDVPGNAAARTLYRYLSAGSHVQPHALLSLIRRETADSRGDGSALVSLALDGRLLMVWSLAAVGGLTIAMDNCAALNGWPPDRWQQRVVPIFNDLRRGLGIAQPIRGVQLLG